MRAMRINNEGKDLLIDTRALFIPVSRILFSMRSIRWKQRSHFASIFSMSRATIQLHARAGWSTKQAKENSKSQSNREWVQFAQSLVILDAAVSDKCASQPPSTQKHRPQSFKSDASYSSLHLLSSSPRITWNNELLWLELLPHCWAVSRARLCWLHFQE